MSCLVTCSPNKLRKKWLVGKELSSQVLRLTLAISLWLTLAHSSSTLLSLSHFGSLALTRAYFGSLYSSLCLYLAFARHATSLLHNCSLSSPDSVNIAVPQTNHLCVFSYRTNDRALLLVPSLLQNLLFYSYFGRHHGLQIIHTNRSPTYIFT